MHRRSESPENWDEMRERIIGMGESSIHKSYYPLLQQRVLDLERFRALIDETNDLILVIQAADKPPVDANQACSSHLGYARETLLARPVENILPEKDRESFRQLVGAAAVSRRQEKAELALVSSDGAQLPVELSIRFVTFDAADYGVIVAHDIRDRKRYERALLRAQKKLNLINFFTRNEIQSQVFILRAYLEVLRQIAKHPEEKTVIEKLNGTLAEIQRQIKFAENYRDVGAEDPIWQNFNEVLLLALSHLPPITIIRATSIKHIELLSDSLFEKGLTHLMEYLYLHGGISAEVTVTHAESKNGLLIILEREGSGISEDQKEAVFSWENPVDKSHSLFFTREVLDITAIAIRETGSSSRLRFEILVPHGTYRIAASGQPGAL